MITGLKQIGRIYEIGYKGNYYEYTPTYTCKIFSPELEHEQCVFIWMKNPFTIRKVGIPIKDGYSPIKNRFASWKFKDDDTTTEVVKDLVKSIINGSERHGENWSPDNAWWYTLYDIEK